MQHKKPGFFLLRGKDQVSLVHCFPEEASGLIKISVRITARITASGHVRSDKNHSVRITVRTRPV
ncbi:MAG: hypothetical protein DRI57_29485 [Deltaproteobacteria bacterium]|nr:MAG: hypothetical protein DRI57_29485 [Deltaproteobacteria bacterium]